MSISQDRETVSIEPGARWGQVYEFLDQYDVTAISGRVAQVGVRGLILRGEKAAYRIGLDSTDSQLTMSARPTVSTTAGYTYDLLLSKPIKISSSSRSQVPAQLAIPSIIYSALSRRLKKARATTPASPASSLASFRVTQEQPTSDYSSVGERFEVNFGHVYQQNKLLEST
ncbi:hypothetical protein CC86DRAFT_452751 [Ophiobolus disseminans]|uniref:Uncharacterized protein n=1 Tax=Ophiobolus disseminans TaxID=1469910 RepID=A0A6A7AES8_9PLEO|nr:hypothetical protein CC86DRAFT_452751 [Ophiobolus disseminans]